MCIESQNTTHENNIFSDIFRIFLQSSSVTPYILVRVMVNLGPILKTLGTTDILDTLRPYLGAT